jgi:hypothetical protein
VPDVLILAGVAGGFIALLSAVLWIIGIATVGDDLDGEIDPDERQGDR